MHHMLDPIGIIAALLAFIGFTLLLVTTASYWIPSLIVTGLTHLV